MRVAGLAPSASLRGVASSPAFPVCCLAAGPRHQTGSQTLHMFAAAGSRVSASAAGWKQQDQSSLQNQPLWLLEGGDPEVLEPNLDQMGVRLEALSSERLLRLS